MPTPSSATSLTDERELIRFSPLTANAGAKSRCIGAFYLTFFRLRTETYVSVPGVFKLDHLQPFKHIFFKQFSEIFTFILGGQFLLPQKPNSEKREISQLQKEMRQGVFSAWGIQMGSFAAF